MKPIQMYDDVVMQGAEASQDYSVDPEDMPMLFHVLRNSLYADKISSVIREYVSNAWDEHRECGKGDVSVQVTYPTSLEPEFKVRDFGRGLSHSEVFARVTKYGRSTKRNSNDVVGMLGLGMKCGFAYSDSFYIVSWHEGVKRTYMAVIENSDGSGGRGKLVLVDERESDEPSGLEIRIPVQRKDIYTFCSRANDFLAYVQPLPVVLNGGELVSKLAGLEEFPSGWIAPGNAGLNVLMGCVLYPVTRPFERKLRRTMILKAPIGELSVTASRESLEYTDRTTSAVVRLIQSLESEVMAKVEASLSSALSGFERQFTSLRAEQAYGFGNSYRSFQFTCTEVATLYEGFGKNRFSTEQISLPRLAPCKRIVIRDRRKDVRGYLSTHENFYIYPKEGVDPEVVRAALYKSAKEQDLEGLDFPLASTLPFDSSYSKAMGASHPKYRKKIFTNTNGEWTPVSPDVQVTPNDVHVILTRFKPDDIWARARVRFVRSWLPTFFPNEPLPVLYGVRESVVDDLPSQGSYAWWVGMQAKFRSHPEAARVLELPSGVGKRWLEGGEGCLPTDHDLMQLRAVLLKYYDFHRDVSSYLEREPNGLLSRYPLIDFDDTIEPKHIAYIQMVDYFNTLWGK